MVCANCYEEMVNNVFFISTEMISMIKSFAVLIFEVSQLIFHKN